MAQPIYKIAHKSDWEAAVAAGQLVGTPVDIKDGYIHFSTAGQLAETLNKHYRGQSDLIFATIDPELLGEPLRWEQSRGGQLFPHLYAALPLAAVTRYRTLSARADGRFDLPETES